MTDDTFIYQRHINTAPVNIDNAITTYDTGLRQARYRFPNRYGAIVNTYTGIQHGRLSGTMVICALYYPLDNSYSANIITPTYSINPDQLVPMLEELFQKEA